MLALPRISGREARQALERLGWEYKHHTGSHMILDKPGQEYTLCVPDHKELRGGTLRGIIRMSGVSVDEFLTALKRR